MPARHGLRSKREPHPVLCLSRFWLRGSATGMRLIQASRECVSEDEADSWPGLLDARGALMLEGRA